MKIAVKVIPRSGRQDVAIEAENSLKCHLFSPPEDGKANKELIELLAGVLAIPKRSVAVVQGCTSRNKIIEIVGIANWDEFLSRVAAKK